MSDISRYLRSDYAGVEIHEVLHQPLSVLLGVNLDAINALNDIGIKTVFDLGASSLFGNAKIATEADQPSTLSGRTGLAPLNTWTYGMSGANRPREPMARD